MSVDCLLTQTWYFYPAEAIPETTKYCELQYKCRLSPIFLLKMQKEWRIAPGK